MGCRITDNAKIDENVASIADKLCNGDCDICSHYYKEKVS